MPFGGAYISYEELFDRSPSLDEIKDKLRLLDPIETSALLSQVNADLRLVKREREAYGKLQREVAGFLLDDETINQAKLRFGTVHCGDRPFFHSHQILTALRLAIQNCTGTGNPRSEETARYSLGTACLMINDVLITPEEKNALTEGDEDSRRRALMLQIIGPFEIVNTAAITHLVYRSRIVFRILLREPRILARLRKDCNEFDLEQEFLVATGLPLTIWLFLIFLTYAYFINYLGENDIRKPEFLGIDRSVFRGSSNITRGELEAFVSTMSLNLASFRDLLNVPRGIVDWRFDFTPFKGKPLLELIPDKFFCTDLGFLIEKMYGGVYWTLFDRLPERRNSLFQAWGILFEEYVNWFLGGRRYCTPISFYPAPAWSDGSECFDGAFLQDTRFMPMEYKGKVLKMEARYSGDLHAFESDLDLKFVEGCYQLARKIETLFSADVSRRRKLKYLSLDHITRVVPVLVVQDQILRGPFVNWYLNKKFFEILNRELLRNTLIVDPLTVVGINELETMAESAEGGSFDIFHGLQLRCFKDPDMKSELQDFLLTVPGYAQGKSARVERVMHEQWEELKEYSFGKEAFANDAGSESI